MLSYERRHLAPLPEIGIVSTKVMVHQSYVNSLVANLLTMELRDGVAGVIDGSHSDKADVRVVRLCLNPHAMHLLNNVCNH